MFSFHSQRIEKQMILKRNEQKKGKMIACSRSFIQEWQSAWDSKSRALKTRGCNFNGIFPLLLNLPQDIFSAIYQFRNFPIKIVLCCVQPRSFLCISKIFSNNPSGKVITSSWIIQFEGEARMHVPQYIQICF